MSKLSRIWDIIKERSDKTESIYEEHYIKGHRFRVIKNFGSTAFKRVVAFNYASKNVDYGLLKGDINIALDMILEANENRKSNDVAALATYMKANLSEYTPTRVLWEVANCFILIDGESEKELNDKFSLKKKELCENSEEIEFFFLKLSTDILNLTGNLSKDIEIGDYSREGINRTNEKAFLNRIKKKIYS